MPTTLQSTTEPGPQFIRATAMARTGRYEEAMTALQIAFAEQECSEVQALDLKARIHAQQGYYLAAESCWERARKLDPDNPAYDRALARLRKPRGDARLALTVSIFAAVVMAALLLRAHLSIIPLQQRQCAILESGSHATQNAISVLQNAASENAGSLLEVRRTLAQMDSQLAALRTSDITREQQLARIADAAAARMVQLETALRRDIQSANPQESLVAIQASLANVEQQNKKLTDQMELLRKQSQDQFDQMLFFGF